MTDLRMHSPATARNRQPILDVLRGALPEQACILEVASGSGEHAVQFARAMPGWLWQPSDTDADALASINAWRDEACADNLQAPVTLDVTRHTWPSGPHDAVVAINLIHIAPWNVTEALLVGASQHLKNNGLLVLYGPFMRGGTHTADSNAAFDTQLRARDPRWGVRDLDVVAAVAEDEGLRLDKVVEMPANNLTVLFRRDLDHSGGPTQRDG